MPLLSSLTDFLVRNIAKKKAVYMEYAANELKMVEQIKPSPSKRPPTSPSQSRKLYVQRSIVIFYLASSIHIPRNLKSRSRLSGVGQSVKTESSDVPVEISWKSTESI